MVQMMVKLMKFWHVSPLSKGKMNDFERMVLLGPIGRAISNFWPALRVAQIEVILGNRRLDLRGLLRYLFPKAVSQPASGNVVPIRHPIGPYFND